MKPKGLYFSQGRKLLLEIQADGILAGVIPWHLLVLTKCSLERPRHNALVLGTLCSVWSQNQ